jgi:regulator of sirC expression with transglutaminase-like and TPR domain
VDAVQRFAALVAGPAPGPPLDLGALAIAAGADPELDPAWTLGELDRIAAGLDSVEALLNRVFVEEGFAGDTDNYYDPRNSLLPDVLARRRGIPITLSVVCIEAGRRAGIAVEGIGMPGHFLIRPAGTQAYQDPFTGSPLDLAGCEALFRGATGATEDVPFGPHLLTVAPPKAILARILENLRAVYRAAARLADLEWVLRMRLELPGAGDAVVAELGEVLAAQGRWLQGAELLQARGLGRAARALRSRLN